MRRLVCTVALLALAGFGHVHAACFTVYDKAGQLVLRTDQSPVDLRRQIGDTVPERFGVGATMVMATDGRECLLHGVGAAVVPFSGAEWDHLESGSLASLAGAYAGSPLAGGGRGGALGYPHVGPRGGHFRYSSGGNKVYRGRGR